jgi:WD40 repeat protein
VGAYQAVVWDVTTGEEVARLEEGSGFAGRIGSVAFTEGGALLACVVKTRDPQLAVWDVTGGRLIWRPESGSFDALQLSPDGRLVAGLSSTGAAAAGQATILETATGNAVGQLRLAGMPLGPRMFTADGRWLVTAEVAGSGLPPVIETFPRQAALGSGNVLYLQSFPGGADSQEIVGPSAPTAFDANSDARLLAIGYQDGSVTLRTMPGFEEILRADFCSEAVSQLAFTRDGHTLAISDGISAIQYLDLDVLRQQLAEIRLNW